MELAEVHVRQGAESGVAGSVAPIGEGVADYRLTSVSVGVHPLELLAGHRIALEDGDDLALTRLAAGVLRHERNEVAAPVENDVGPTYRDRGWTPKT